jgi:hypothetical protein
MVKPLVHMKNVDDDETSQAVDGSDAVCDAHRLLRDDFLWRNRAVADPPMANEIHTPSTLSVERCARVFAACWD